MSSHDSPDEYLPVSSVSLDHGEDLIDADPALPEKSSEPSPVGRPDEDADDRSPTQSLTVLLEMPASLSPNPLAKISQILISTGHALQGRDVPGATLSKMCFHTQHEKAGAETHSEVTSPPVKKRRFGDVGLQASPVRPSTPPHATEGGASFRIKSCPGTTSSTAQYSIEARFHTSFGSSAYPSPSSAAAYERPSPRAPDADPRPDRSNTTSLAAREEVARPKTAMDDIEKVASYWVQHCAACRFASPPMPHDHSKQDCPASNSLSRNNTREMERKLVMGGTSSYCFGSGFCFKCFLPPPLCPNHYTNQGTAEEPFYVRQNSNVDCRFQHILRDVWARMWSADDSADEKRGLQDRVRQQGLNPEVPSEWAKYHRNVTDYGRGYRVAWAVEDVVWVTLVFVSQT